MHDDIEHCLNRIAHEEALIRAAGSAEAAEVHHQIAMLYRAQLSLLKRSVQRPAGSEAPLAPRILPRPRTRAFNGCLEAAPIP